MKICLVSTIGYPPRVKLGGVPNYTRNLAHALVQARHRVSVITKSTKGAPPEEYDGPVHVYWASLPNAHYYFHRLIPHAGYWPRVIRAMEWGWAVRKLILGMGRRDGIDVVQYPNVWNTAVFHPGGVPYAVRMNTPLCTARDVMGCGDQHGWGTYEAIERRVVHRANMVSCHTPSIAKLVMRVYDIPLERIAVIPSPVDVQLFTPIPKPTRRRLRIFHPGPRLDDWQKGTQVLLHAMQDVLHEVPNVEVYLAGRGKPNFGGLTKRVIESIKLLGWLEPVSLAEQYALADVSVVPSLNWDTFPNVCLESLACGTPVIGTSVGGIPEVVQHGENGLVVPPENHRALSEAIVELLSNSALRKQMGRQARQEAEERYSFEAVGHQLTEAFNRVANARGDAGPLCQR